MSQAMARVERCLICQDRVLAILTAYRPGEYPRWVTSVTSLIHYVTFTLEQATKAQRESRGIALHFL
jgi:hypothetical protein